ncbi:MAG: hypothetical protein MJE77_32345 [Proteobacteria bacterium]|nr:hypothetical protein [Pseudomonadota bacterium]
MASARHPGRQGEAEFIWSGAAGRCTSRLWTLLPAAFLGNRDLINSTWLLPYYPQILPESRAFEQTGINKSFQHRL